jgi:hypothetical protein
LKTPAWYARLRIASLVRRETVHRPTAPPGQLGFGTGLISAAIIVAILCVNPHRAGGGSEPRGARATSRKVIIRQEVRHTGTPLLALAPWSWRVRPQKRNRRAGRSRLGNFPVCSEPIPTISECSAAGPANLPRGEARKIAFFALANSIDINGSM